MEQITMLGLTATPARIYPFLVVDPDKPIFIAPDTTTIYGWFTDPSGDPRIGVSVVAVADQKIESGSVIIEKGQREETTTDSTGYFEMTLTVGKYTLKVDCVETYCLPVPSHTDMVNIQDII